MFCYLLFPVLILTIARYGKGWALIVGLSLCAALLFAVSRPAGGSLGSVVTGYASIIRALAGFMAGMLLYNAWQEGWVHRLRPLFVAVACLSLSVFLVWHQDALLVVAEACVVVLCLDARSPLFAFLNAPHVQWLGRISYSIYLWHAAVLFAIAALIVANGVEIGITLALAGPICIVAAILCTLILSHWSFKYFERPSRSWIRSSFKVVEQRFALKSD